MRNTGKKLNRFRFLTACQVIPSHSFEGRLHTLYVLLFLNGSMISFTVLCIQNSIHGTFFLTVTLNMALIITSQ